MDSKLDLPSLEGGKKASSLLHKYLQGVSTRMDKLSEIKGRIESVPVSDRGATLNKSDPYFSMWNVQVMYHHGFDAIDIPSNILIPANDLGCLKRLMKFNRSWMQKPLP